MRLAGSRMLAASGLRLHQIELMARWKSPMLLRYAQTAPLLTIYKDLEEASTKRNLAEQLEQLRQEMGRLERDTRQGIPHVDTERRLKKVEITGLT